jgi:hypothetical protein
MNETNQPVLVIPSNPDLNVGFESRPCLDFNPPPVNLNSSFVVEINPPPINLNSPSVVEINPYPINLNSPSVVDFTLSPFSFPSFDTPPSFSETPEDFSPFEH